MISRARPYLLGILGIGILTFPFLWLGLRPDFTQNTMAVGWAPEHGLQFLGDLSPVFFLIVLCFLGNRLNRHFCWSDSVGKSAAFSRTAKLWNSWWAWALMPLVLVAPLFLSAPSVSLFTNVGIYMLLALGLNITVGMTGLLVLGYAGFYGFGAYFFALMQNNFSYFPWWMAAPFAFFLGGGVGYLLGLPCLRLRGDYLAIVTLGFAEAFRVLVGNLDVTGADKGISFHPGSTFHAFAGLRVGQVAFISTALVLFLAVFLIQRLYHSPVGRAWIAIRENEIAAASVGVPVVQLKLLAFALSAAIAAVAGVLYGALDGFVDPSIAAFQQSIMVLAMVILGGLGNTYGALLGAALLYLVPEYLKLLPSALQDTSISDSVPPFLNSAFMHISDYRWLLFGAIMVVMMLYRPQGLLGSGRRKAEILHR